MVKIRPKTFAIVLIQIILLVVENNVLDKLINNTTLQTWYGYMCGFIVINIIFQIIGLYEKRKLFSFGAVIILFSYLMQCSHVILLGLNLVPADSAIYTVFLSKHGHESFMKALLIGLNSIAAYFIGYVLCARDQEYPLGEKYIDVTNHRLLKNFGWVMTIVFGAVYYYATITMIVYSVTSGSYEGLVTVANSTIISNALNLQGFFFAGSYLLMIYYKLERNIKVSKIILLVVIFSLLLSFMSGARSRAMIFLVVLMILWVSDIEKISFKKLIIYALSALLLLQMLFAVRKARNEDFSIYSVMDNFASTDNNLFYETLSEFGVSVFVTASFINEVDVGHPSDFFVKEIGAVLPKISSWGGEIFKDSTIRTGIENKYHIGNTYIADFYYYFDNWTPIMLTLYGCWMALIDNLINKWRHGGNYLAIAIAIPGICNIVGSIRSASSLGFKMFLYSWIIFMIFYVFFSKGKVQRR